MTPLESEQLLRETEQRLQMALLVSRSYAFEWERKTDLVWRSAGCAAILGLAGEEIQHDTGQRYFQRIHPEDRGAFVAGLDALRPDSSSYRTEYRLVRGDGREIVLEEIGQGFFAADGSLDRLVGIATDITQRKQAEAALRASEQRFRLALRSAPVSVAVQDSDLRYIWAFNQRTARPEDILGKADSQIFTPEEAVHLTAIKRRVLEENVEVREQMWLDRPGGRMYVDVCFEPVRDSAGRTVGVGCATVDLTATKLAEEALRKSEERYRLLGETMLQGVVHQDAEGQIIAMNPAAERILGRTRQELLGGSSVDQEHHTVHDDGSPFPGLEHPSMEALRTGMVVRGVRMGVFNPQRGERRWINIDAIPVYQERGDRPAEVYTVFEDITERRQLEQERQQLLEAERAARGELERVNRMKDEFLSTLSHELRSPLSAVLGWTKLLRRGKAGDPERALGVIEANAQSLAQMIDDMLDIGRIMSGKVRLSFEDTEPRSLVGEVIDGFRPAAQAKNIQLHEDCDQNLGILNCDPARIRQVVSNLLSNALKFTPSGGSIEVKLRRRRDRLQIIVRDSGQGIAREFLPHLFGKFLQADAGTTRKHGGLGLGLTIAKQIVDLHGGRIRAASAGENRGAVFIVSLPCSEPTREGAGVLTETARSEGQLELPAGMTILLVDDDPEVLVMMSRVLSESGVQVVTATSAKAALALVRERQPGVVISDLSMPGDDGYTLVRQVRGMGGAAGATVCVALSSLARPEDRERALAAGFDEHLSKLTDPATIVRTVRELVIKSLLEKYEHELCTRSETGR